jgi:hypothetical protein
MEKRFIQYKRVGDSWPSKAQGSIDDMPERHWKRIQRTRDGSRYQFLKLIDLEIKGGPIKSADIPIIEDPYECPLCGFVAENDNKLEVHKMTIHGT